MNKDKLLTTRELANFLKIDEKTVRKYVNYGLIPCYKIGRYFRFKYDEVMNSMKVRDDLSPVGEYVRNNPPTKYREIRNNNNKHSNSVTFMPPGL